MTKKNDLLTVEGIKKNLTTRFIGADIYLFDAIDSTNSYAHKLAKEGAKEGTVVLSESQSKGKGRLGRTWFSPSGVNIYLSVILMPQMPSTQITLLTFAAAIAVAKAIRDIAGLDADIKWPNDILIRGKKVAGILSEMETNKNPLMEGLSVKFSIIGIGINVNLDKKDIPLELMDNATSIKIESNSTIDRMNLICRVLENLEEWYNLFERNGVNDIIEEWKSLAITIGRDVKVQSGNSFVEGRAVDIDENGALLIKDRDGVIQRVLSGDVI
ncbi:MAG: biotin--[acetyl-CoA-carboxylase] ligase [Nitrospirae bacterium]|nr:biotin--[acetyl-CoA-carboxylase] ligase [Nitrospirota bacterium]